MPYDFKPYEGSEPYLFISYSHKNKNEVFKILNRMNQDGYRIWYDEGIEWGTEWPTEIANHLVKAQAVLFFHSKDSLASQNCRQEIFYSIKKGKPTLSIYLEEVELDRALDMQLSLTQSTYYFQYFDPEDFFKRLNTTDLIKYSRNFNSANLSVENHSNLNSLNLQPPLGKQVSSPEYFDRKKKWFIGSFIFLGITLMASSVFWWIISTDSTSRDKSEDQHFVVKTDDEAIQLEVTPESSIALNYSGASCIVMALDLQGINASQSSIGNQLGLNEGKISNYRDLTQIINSSLIRNGSNTLYSNFYLVTDDLTSQEKIDLYTLFLSRVDQSLQDGKATLVVIGSSPDGKLQGNFYGLIYGKTTVKDETTYSIIIPYTDEAKRYDVDFPTLATMVSIPKALCYIY